MSPLTSLCCLSELHGKHETASFLSGYEQSPLTAIADLTIPAGLPAINDLI